MIEGINKNRLAPHVKPITSDVGTIEDFKKRTGPVKFFVNNPDVLSILDTTNFGSDSDILDQQRSLHAGKGTYVISSINEYNKYEKGIYMCTVLIVIGKNRATGKNISFVSHQFPGEFLSDKKEKFISDLTKRLLELKDICEADTIDAVIVGGKEYGQINSNHDVSDKMKNWYKDSIKLLEEQIQKNLNFKPTIVNGPKKIDEKKPDLVILDTKERQIYFLRPEVNTNVI